MAGTIVSHNRILEKFGGRGRGTAYKAADTKLIRNAALTFLPENT